MALRPSRVFSIPFGVSFLDALTDALLEGPLGALIDFAGDPLTLAQATLYVPTRRAGRALAAKLAERLRGRTTVLPRIVPLGETDALELSWLADPSADAGLRPAIGETQRRDADALLPDFGRRGVVGTVRRAADVIARLNERSGERHRADEDLSVHSVPDAGQIAGCVLGSPHGNASSVLWLSRPERKLG